MRGGASVPCAKCGKPTRVLRTTRVEGAVHRDRSCPYRHRTYTVETQRAEP